MVNILIRIFSILLSIIGDTHCTCLKGKSVRAYKPSFIRLTLFKKFLSFSSFLGGESNKCLFYAIQLVVLIKT